MTLHLVSKSPFSSSALRDCLQSFAEGDALLLIEDGVYALRHDALQTLQNSAVYCLEADAAARGQRELAAIVSGIKMIDDAGWVKLCTQHNPIVSWFR
ncbi:protein TusB [Microbulbifer sp. NBRC 101763]|uniref:sulfurtransferase complex subunit TusB n=1 Tax=Microbulbifer TaxID=48073 RepID=UPI00036B01AC|nr:MULTISPECIES: sulfurtransferase complex subunit TusB [Microbulbifer]WHI49438.1 sulfurtransferase complex subunit TusB [Microbulbifer sp. MLAF003]